MENSYPDYFECYYNRLKKCRRTYFYEKLDELSWKNPISFIKLAKWFQSDLVFTAKWSLNILLQIRRYGPAIRKEYGRSYWSQWKGLMYVMFRLGSYPRYYKSRLLYKESNWQFVDDFVFNHYPVLREFAHMTSEDELPVLKNKFEFYQSCVSKDIPTPEVFSVIQKGEVIFQKIDTLIPGSPIFIKNLSAGKGARVHKFDFVDGIYSDRKNNSYTEGPLKSYLTSISKNEGDIILQAVLENHVSWKKFTTGTLATCRIVSARNPEEDKITPLFGCFRMPVGDLDADNYSLGGIIAPVDLSTGKLGVAVSSKPINGKFEFAKHPDTDQQIEGEILPQWNNLLKFTLDVHNHFKTIFVGWDVSLTTKGCSMIEGNVGWASGSYEIPFQDSLKNTPFPELFEKWWEKYE